MCQAKMDNLTTELTKVLYIIKEKNITRVKNRKDKHCLQTDRKTKPQTGKEKNKSFLVFF